MLRNHLALVFGVCGALAIVSIATPAAAVDTVQSALDKAKAARESARVQARDTLTKALDEKIKAAGAAGDLNALKALTTQKDAFVAGGVPPIHPSVKDAAAAYQLALQKGDGQLVTAYESAIDDYNRQQKFNEATALRQERRALLEGPVGGVPATPGPAGGQPQPPETIAATLKQSKVVHEQGLAEAKATLLTAIDTRINAASEAGDLKTVTAMKAARATAAADGSIAAEVKDPSILAAKKTYDISVKTVDANMVQAYQSAVREYTRAKKIDEATAVQAELDASPLAQPAAVAAKPKTPAIEPPTRLGKLLPPLFNATGTYGAAKDGGVEPAKGTHIITKPADFMSPTRDWVFDIWVHVERKDGWGNIGIGTGKSEESLTIAVKSPGDQHHGIYLTHGDVWGDKMGDLREPGDYMVRLEKTGSALTFSFGEEKDGKFEPDLSRTVSEPHTFMTKLSDKSAHLFFSGGLLYKQYRLTFKQPGAPSDTPPPKTTPVDPKKPKK